MFLRKYWFPITVFFVAIVGICLYMLTTRTPKAPITIIKPVEVEKPTAEAPAPKPPPPGASPNGHWHGDEWHPGPHEARETPAVPEVQNTAPPGAVTTPDFPPVDPNEDPVEAAYKRLEYIKNNPYAWGGVHSERATELIAQLMPPPRLIDHDHGDEVREQIIELIAQNDPRAGEVLITTMCNGNMGGVPMFDGLEAIGPPVVPYILPYLEKGVAEGGYIRLAVFESLERIGVRYRADLGGIVDHIIIPKLAVIAADEDNERYEHATVMDAKYTLEQLGR